MFPFKIVASHILRTTGRFFFAKPLKYSSKIIVSYLFNELCNSYGSLDNNCDHSTLNLNILLK